MPKRKQVKTRLSVPVTVDQKEILEDMAIRREISIARVVQEAIREFIERHPDNEVPLFDFLHSAPPQKG